MKRIKYLIFILFFIVTWNEYKVIWINEKNTTHCDDYGNCWKTSMAEPLPKDRKYEVHLATFTQRLERKIDVDLFQGIISPNAFNIRVEKVDE